ncbi:MAG: hypothetical protein ABIR71_11875, partial [Chthoniobacterales bacterium]
MKKTSRLALILSVLVALPFSGSVAQDAVSTTERVIVKDEIIEKTELSGEQAAAPASVSVIRYT